MSEAAVGIPNHGNQGIIESLDQWSQSDYLWGSSTFRNRNDDVVLLYHSQITMDGISGMHKECRLTGTIERGNDFLGDDGAFAYSCKYGTTLIGKQ